MRFWLVLFSALSVVAQNKPPATAVHPVTENLHGTTVTDPYRWLEDQESPETRAWIDAQMKYTRAALDPLPQRARWKARLTELHRTETKGLPRERGGKYFFEKRGANENRAAICVRRSLQGPDEVLVDPAAVSKDETVSVDLLDVTPDGKLLAFGVRKGGADEFEVLLLDVDRKQPLPDHLPPMHYINVLLVPDHSGLYFTDLDPGKGPRAFFRPLGRETIEPKQIFGQGFGAEYILEANLSEDGRFLTLNMVQGSAGNRTEVWLLDRLKGGRPQPVVRDLDARTYGFVGGGRLFLITNWQAPRSRVFVVNPEQPQRFFWKLIVPEARWNLESLDLSGERLLVTYTRNASSMVMVLESDGRYAGEAELPGLGALGGVSGRWGAQEFFVGYESFTTPSMVLRFDAKTLARTTWYRDPVPVDSTAFESEQIWFSSKDGTRVPMFVVHKKGLHLDGTNPALLTGYGGFNVSVTPYFWSAGVAWMEQGGVLVSANLRGGGEFGEEWHRAGMLARKQHVFDDFIAAAEELVRRKYTSPGKLAILGGSNGGLLVGAAMVQRPELFRAVVCEVPLLDMLRYQKFLVAGLWVPEYGSSDDPGQFEYLLRYSPYQNVKDGVKYPAVLFVTGDSDTRVAPLHARKMTARVQAATASGLPVLLLYDTKTGHSGGKPVSQIIEDETDTFSFLAWQLGM
ncbi:MAG: prolyl oligopeptidase family serine peptidase [Paludibaculum sp.]